MVRNVSLFFFGLILFSSCNNEEKQAVNFAIFFEPLCEESFSVLCVNAEEFRRIKEVFLENENGAELDCLPIMVTDLEGTVYEGFLRGYSSTDEDLPCVQEVNF